MSTASNRVSHTFPPIYDQNSRILILGTFPSVKSREGDFYYHHPQNRFWKVLGRIFGVDVPQTIEDKKQMLLDNQTAIWDVIAVCDIVGSSDASIRNIVPNDISMILKNSPIERIYANGNKAYELYMKYCFPKTGREIIKLPSTSPANAAFSLDKLVGIWKAEILSISPSYEAPHFLTLKELCQELSISMATGRNWIKSGRLIPTDYNGKTPLFTRKYAQSFQERIQTSSENVLKSRRNKNQITGNQFYHSYLSSDSPNSSHVQSLLTVIENGSYKLDKKSICTILADCALQLYEQAGYFTKHTEDNFTITSSETFSDFLEGRIDCGKRQSLIHALIADTSWVKEFTKQYSEIFSIKYTYVPGEDLLGLLYLSLRNMGNRKVNGAYYTPAATVRQLLKELPAPTEYKFLNELSASTNTSDFLSKENISYSKAASFTPNTTLLDPCCGTGNFLLQLPDNWEMEQLFASDIDEISVAITRINLSLKFPDATLEMLNNHVRCQDFLKTTDSSCYNYIIGNPPWGFAFSEKEKTTLRQHYTCAGKNPESYDLFVEKALQHLKDNGHIAFVLPEAILNVRSHRPVRQLICDSCNIHKLTYLGNIFDGVQCPSVILQLVKTNQQIRLSGTRITLPEKSFTIKRDCPVTAENFHLAVTDEEYALLQKIETVTPTKTLKGNADFALGIVTGDNKRYLNAISTETATNSNASASLRSNNHPTTELVLKGSDIEKYHIKTAKYSIDFQPEHFQQCAPVELYRAPEKLLYRFIGRRLVFAYDDKQHISLNSCNIVIPRIEGLHIKYILTILNSRIAQFFVQKKWNSLKVLRSHLEQIPIPIIPIEMQEYYICMADSLMQTDEPDKKTQLYNELDKSIADLFSLSQDEYALIQRIS